MAVQLPHPEPDKDPGTGDRDEQGKNGACTHWVKSIGPRAAMWVDSSCDLYHKEMLSNILSIRGVNLYY
jgi:hypothetical protein